MPPLKALESPDLYTVGWISALPLERAVATAILDEKHEKPLGFVQPPNDTNSYTWGRIGEHNVVIASLAAGKYGTTSATVTASAILASFPQIRIGLLVGIGAGIPRPEKGHDIRLGDVVVSQPSGNTGGVIQYDLFKAKPGNQRESKAFLNSPPEILLHALANLQSQHILEAPKMLEYLEETMKRYPRLAKQGYVHQGFENDRLFETTDPSKEIQREDRDSTEPEIHYGVIASGNTLFKDAVYRDEILTEVGEDCICMEMEAAGLMNNFPCVVIRGISDYADTHKDNRWQCYAAATAAAYAKELLDYVPDQGLQNTQKAIDILNNIVIDIRSDLAGARAMVEGLSQDNQSTKIKAWLAPPDGSVNLNEASKKQHGGTCSWFIDHDSFKEWKTGSRRHLWLHGIPGCGKTVLSATIVQHLNQQPDSSSVVLYFFFDFTDTSKQSLSGLLRSLVAQLYWKCQDSRKHLDTLCSSCDHGQQQPTDESLLATFFLMVNEVERIQIVIDALDECKTRRELLQWMKIFSSPEHERIFLLATSRREEELESGLEPWVHRENFVPIEGDSVNIDIRSYICSTLHADNEFRRWRSKPAVLEKIENVLAEKADGMFRWAACQLDILEQCLDLEELQETLLSLPDSLNDTYARILIGIPQQYRKRTIRILQFLTYSERPLLIEEAVDAIATDPDRDPHFDPERRMPEPREITRICSSLVSLVTRSNYNNEDKTVMELQLAHSSVKEYLVSGRVQESLQKSMSQMDGIFQRGMADFSVTLQKDISEETARGCLVRICLVYLCQLDKRQSVEEIREQFPLAKYSARYWMQHAKFSETRRDVQDIICNFFLQQKQAHMIWIRLFDPQKPREDEPYPRPEAENPLYYASLAGLHRTVELLLEKGAGIDDKSGEYGSALTIASNLGHKEVVQLLLEKGANVNNDKGAHGTPLHCASRNGHTEIMGLLLDNGADIEPQSDTLDGTPLQEASRQGHTEAIKLLLSRGADINAKAGILCNALQAASRCRKDVVQLLLDNGADVNAKGGKLFGSALTAASFDGHKDIVQLLLDRGADVNIQGGWLRNALQAASYEGHEDVVQLLLERGADVNTHDKDFGEGMMWSKFVSIKFD